MSNIYELYTQEYFDRTQGLEYYYRFHFNKALVALMKSFDDVYPYYEEELAPIISQKIDSMIQHYLDIQNLDKQTGMVTEFTYEDEEN